MLINTASFSFDHSSKVIKTPVDITLVLDISKYFRSLYNFQTEISTYILIGSVSYKGNFWNSGHYLTYLFSQDRNEVYCFDKQKVNCFNFDKLTSRNNSTFTSETHTILYIRSDYIKGKQEPCWSKFEEVLLDFRQVNYIYIQNLFGFVHVSSKTAQWPNLHKCLSTS